MLVFGPSLAGEVTLDLQCAVYSVLRGEVLPQGGIDIFFHGMKIQVAKTQERALQ